MVKLELKQKNYKILFLTIILLCFLPQASCTRQTSSQIASEKFYLYNSAHFEIKTDNENLFEFSNKSVISDGKGRLLISYNKNSKDSGENLGRFLRLFQNGKWSGKEYKLAELFKDEKIDLRKIGFQFVPGGFAAFAFQDGNIFYSGSKENLENWSPFIQINDEQDAVVGNTRFLQTNERDLYLVWVDKRRGWHSIFFSASRDGGKSWLPNQQVEYDYREEAQSNPTLIEGADGRLLLFWQDFRDRRTLLDIRLSYSDDKGINWLPSRKLNDDEKEVWQANPSAVAVGKNIYVVYDDFREDGEDDDNDWNIYFARSTDNGLTWEKNTRLNDTQPGKDRYPQLVTDNDGNLFCIWWSGRNTLFGQFAFSYSTDQGKSWSPSVMLTNENEILSENPGGLQFVSPGKFLATKILQDNANYKFEHFLIEQSKDKFSDQDKTENSEKDENSSPLKVEIGETIFKEDFSDKKAANWKAFRGVWNVVDEAYLGVDPTGKEAFTSFLSFSEPEEYVLEGKFRLDPVAHTAANIYFRTDEESLRHYLIVNRFRVGAWLCLKDDELPNRQILLYGKPLAQKRFSFKSDRWYQFKLVVTREQVDYYIDGRLMFSRKEKLTLPEGKIGIGGFTFSPTSFDDISISKIRR